MRFGDSTGSGRDLTAIDTHGAAYATINELVPSSTASLCRLWPVPDKMV